MDESQPAVAAPVERPVRRAVASVSGWRYAMQPVPPALSWHTAHVGSRAYRCQCMPLFRAGGDRYGPSPAKKGRKKARTTWKRRPGTLALLRWLEAPNAELTGSQPT